MSTLSIGVTAWQQKRTGKTIIPAHWWTIILGTCLVLYLLSRGDVELFGIVVLINQILTLVVLLALERTHLTLRGLIGFSAILSLLVIFSEWNLWAGRIALGISLLAWWLWGKKFLSFPLSFWVILSVLVASAWMWQQHWLSDLQASISISIITLLLLIWEYLSVKSKRKFTSSS